MANIQDYQRFLLECEEDLKKMKKKLRTDRLPSGLNQEAHNKCHDIRVVLLSDLSRARQSVLELNKAVLDSP